jgi:hypothetical protein
LKNSRFLHEKLYLHRIGLRVFHGGIAPCARNDERPQPNRDPRFARPANPYELQAEMGLTKWAEFAVFRGFDPDDWIFGTEFGLLTKEPYLLSVGFVNWSPHLDVDPQPFIEAGYYTEHNKFIVGGIHAGYKNEAILGYAYDFNKTWRAQVDWQSGSENSSTIGFTCNLTRDFQCNPAIYFSNDDPGRVMGTSCLPIPFTCGVKKKIAR